MQLTPCATRLCAPRAKRLGVRLLVAACGSMMPPVSAAAPGSAEPTVPAGVGRTVSSANAAAASADEFPQRRAGLWEVDTVGAQAAGLPAAQYCVDETTDRAALHLDRSSGVKGACRFGAFQRSGDGWVSETVCREGRSVVTTRSVATGDFQASYRIDTLITYEPPLGGFRREERTATVGRRLGACLPGQAAGDLAIPGMGRFNMKNGSVVADEPDPKARKRRAPKQQADG